MADVPRPGRGARRQLDLLPLLDVMMVVLFAFATVQEERIEASSLAAEAHLRAAQAAREEVAGLAGRLEGAEAARARAEEALQAEAVRREAAREEAARRAREEEAARVAGLEEALADARRRAEALEDTARRLREERWPDEGTFRRDDVLDKLLDQNAVIEVEIRGDAGPDGVRNGCCFRGGPRDPRWRPCGAVPPTAEARAEWFRAGAGGLVRALQDTKGGTAVTIVRQDPRATWQIAAGVGQLVREAFPDHRLYQDGVAPLDVRCGPEE